MMQIALRNLVAHRGIAALADDAARPPFEALEVFAEVMDARGAARLDDGVAALLASAGDVFEIDGGLVRMREPFVDTIAEFRDTVSRFSQAVRTSTCEGAPFDWESWEGLPREEARPPDAAQVSWTLCAAAELFDHGLYFETHEIIEPCWLRANGDLKIFLKGLIQVAVGFHHHRNANLRGAHSLMTEGNARLKRFRPRFEGVELDAFCAAVEACAAAVQDQRGSGWRALDPPRIRRGVPLS